jgi:hypothetical protein
MAVVDRQYTTCFNCGSTKHKLVLVWGSGGTFWRCENQRGCLQRLGPCAVESCNRMGDNHRTGWDGRGSPVPLDHEFTRDPAIQAVIDAAYPA